MLPLLLLGAAAKLGLASEVTPRELFALDALERRKLKADWLRPMCCVLEVTEEEEDGTIPACLAGPRDGEVLGSCVPSELVLWATDEGMEVIW